MTQSPESLQDVVDQNAAEGGDASKSEEMFDLLHGTTLLRRLEKNPAEKAARISLGLLERTPAVQRELTHSAIRAMEWQQIGDARWAPFKEKVKQQRDAASRKAAQELSATWRTLSLEQVPGEECPMRQTRSEAAPPSQSPPRLSPSIVTSDSPSSWMSDELLASIWDPTASNDSRWETFGGYEKDDPKASRTALPADPATSRIVSPKVGDLSHTLGKEMP